MLARIAITLALILGLVAGFYALDSRAYRAKYTTAEAARAQAQSDLDASRLLREREHAVAKAHVETITRLRADQRKANAKLSEALAHDAPWRDQAVPAGVADALGVR